MYIANPFEHELGMHFLGCVEASWKLVMNIQRNNPQLDVVVTLPKLYVLMVIIDKLIVIYVGACNAADNAEILSKTNQFILHHFATNCVFQIFMQTRFF